MKQSFARLRLSNHRLEIESGRYDNVKADLRYCKQCQNSDNQTYIEDEKHFLIVCPKFEKERKLFFDKLKTQDDNFANMTDTEKFLYIMTCNKDKTIKETLSFIHNLTRVRFPPIN